MEACKIFYKIINDGILNSLKEHRQELEEKYPNVPVDQFFLAFCLVGYNIVRTLSDNKKDIDILDFVNYMTRLIINAMFQENEFEEEVNDELRSTE